MKTTKLKDIFKLIDELKTKFGTDVSTEWFGSKKTSMFRVKIDSNRNKELVEVVNTLKYHKTYFDKIDIFTNNKGIILFELRPYDYGYLELIDFMAKNKMNTRQSVYNQREKIEYMYRSPKWIYYRFKEDKK